MTMTSAASHVVLGAGPVGIAIARRLAEASAAAVRAATEGASRVYFAAQPAYTNWPQGFPPLVEGVLGGLKGRGVRLAVVDNLYA